MTGASQQRFAHEAGAAWTFGRLAGIAVVVLFLVGIASSVLRLGRRDLDGARRAVLLVWLLGTGSRTRRRRRLASCPTT